MKDVFKVRYLDTSNLVQEWALSFGKEGVS